MIYTIGHRHSYDMGLRDNNPLMKLGFKERYYDDGRDYIGGIAFLDITAAQDEVAKLHERGYDYSVYRLETTPENLRIVNGQYHIIEGARILPL